MPIYNPNDFYPRTGQEVKSDGTTANEADGINPDGSRNVQLTGRNTSYQRILVGQTIAASGSINTVLNLGLGTKAINLTFKTTANAQVTLYPCDANGNALTGGSVASIASTNSGGQTTQALIVSELGGAPYIAIFVFDKSAATNTCNFIDVWWTKA